MTEYIRLNDVLKTSFKLIPNGIIEDALNKRRYFKFTSTLTYTEILTLFKDTVNISSLDYILVDNTVSQTYTDCVGLKSLKYDLNVKINETTTANVYTVELSIDAVETTLQSVNTELTNLSNTIVMVSML